MRVKNIQAGHLVSRRLFPDRSATIGTRHNKKHDKTREDQKCEYSFISEKLSQLVHETKEVEC